MILKHMHWLTRVVMDKGPFNRFFFVQSQPMHPRRTYQNFISPLTLSDLWTFPLRSMYLHCCTAFDPISVTFAFSVPHLSLPFSVLSSLSFAFCSFFERNQRIRLILLISILSIFASCGSGAVSKWVSV